MRRDHLFYLVIGAAVYYAYLRYRRVIAGAPWAPTTAIAA